MKKSAKEVSAVVSAMGALLSIVIDLVAQIKELGADVGECNYRLAQPDGKETLKAIAELIVKEWRKAKPFAMMSLVKLIALSKYDWVDSNINGANFPIDESFNPNEETRLFHFGHEMTSEEVKEEMNKEGWKPATIWHLLINSEGLQLFPIVALGSVWRSLVPYLYWCDFYYKFYLDLLSLGNRWGGNCRFLAVRK